MNKIFTVLKGGYEPERGTKYSSCVDLFAREKVTIDVGETKIVPLGVKINLDALLGNVFNNNKKYIDELGENFIKYHCFELKIRSSGCTDRKLIIPNGVGEIDIDYPKEIGIILHNPFTGMYIISEGTEKYEYISQTIEKGEKIAQIKLVQHDTDLMGYETDKLRTGGFGSTGR